MKIIILEMKKKEKKKDLECCWWGARTWDDGGYRVGKEAAVAMPHWLLLFLAIMMYPFIPQLLPQLHKHNEYSEVLANIIKVSLLSAKADLFLISQ